MNPRIRIVDAAQLETWIGEQTQASQRRSRLARRLWAARAAGRRNRQERCAEVMAVADRDAAALVGAALAHADALRAKCVEGLSETIGASISMLLRRAAAPAWIRAALEDATARLGHITAGELRVAPSQAEAAEQALRDGASAGWRLPVTVQADDTLTEGTVVVITDAGKLVVEMDALLVAVRAVLVRRMAGQVTDLQRTGPNQVVSNATFETAE